MTINRPQAIAIVSAALLVAVLGLALLLGLLALRADHLLAQAAVSAAHGQMHIANVMGFVTESGNTAHQFLSK